MSHETGQQASVELPAPAAGASRWEILVYSHTHWDREWYQPFERFRMQLVAAVDRVIDTLEADDAFTCYVLDGQTIVLDDYLRLRPEQLPRLQRLARDGRIELGPWYILPDEFLVSAEALVRNLLEGRRMAAAFGGVPALGYLPDPFGHIAQLPHLLRGFGIGTVVFSRGMGDELPRLGTEFWWVAPDGESTVLAVVQKSPRVNGYTNAEPLAQVHDRDDATHVEAADELAGHLAGIARLPVMLFAAGTDHETVNPQLPQIVSRLDARYPNASVEIAGLRRITSAYEAAARVHDDELQVHAGELHGSRYQPVLSGIFSARIPLKQDNVRLQAHLERYVEPLSAIGQLTGVLPAPMHVLRHAWRLALQNQPHDSIGGCSVDEVHDEMPSRTLRALELCRGVLEELMFVAGYGDDEVVFNPQPHACGGVATLGDLSPAWVDGLPPLGVVRLPDAVARGQQTPGLPRVVDAATIENDVLRVGVADGAVRVTCRATAPGGDDIVLDDAVRFVDVADAGDEYDFGRLEGDTPVEAVLEAWEARMAAPGIAELVLRHSIAIPECLSDDRKARSSELIGHEIVTTLRIAGDQQWVECTTQWENWSADHRLRMQCSVGGTVERSMADGHWAVVNRPASPLPTEVPWRQEPIASQHCESFCVALPESGAAGVALLMRGLHEYEVRDLGNGRSALEVTLLRAVGWLSRSDVAGRPGHAGPGLATPGAQCLGPLVVEYAIVPLAGDWEPERVTNMARRFVAPPLLVEPIHDEIRTSTGQVARERDLRAARGGTVADPSELASHGVALEGAELSCLKPADDGSGDVVLRCFNPGEGTTTVTLRAGGYVDEVSLVRLDEEPAEGGAIERSADGWLTQVASGGTATFRLRGRQLRPG